MELFFDTETAGLPIWDQHYSHPGQPWVVQLGLILADREQVYNEMCFLIQAGDRAISPEAQKVHGISSSLTNSVGFKESTAAGLFFHMVTKASKLVGHNIAFDVLMIQSLFYRQGFDQFCMHLRGIPTFCTMKSSTNFCKIPQETYLGKFKWPKLEELYKILFKKEMKGAHNALADIRATRQCYYKLQEVL